MKRKVVDKGKFFDLIGYKPHKKQVEFHKSSARFKVAACGRRAGKRLHVNTLIGTPELGFKRMGDIEIGDKVFDDQGRICNVIGVSDVRWEQAYKITFDDGSILYAHDEHEWLTYDKKARKTRNLSEAKHKSDRRRKIVPPKVRTTKQIMDTINYGVEPNHAIELCGPVDYPKKDFIIDPYVLGVWLSDGSKSNGQFSCPDSDNWIVEKIRERGFEVRRSQSGDKCPVWNIIGLIPKLRELGVLKNKHVPRQYLFGSIEQRQDLLYGLMDTDGTAGKGQSCFDNTNKNLADSVEYLICSLGGRVNRSGRVGKLYGVEKKYCYRVWSSNIIDLFSLPRKLKSQKSNPARKNYYRFIKSIEATVMMPMKCIAVDSPSHLYLAGTAFIPTHNTYMTAKDIEPLLMVPNKRVWLVSPTYKLGEKEFRVIWEDMILKLGFGKDPEIKKAYSLSQGNMFITFPWNTTIEVHSAERPDTLVGDGLDLVVMCEAAKHQRETWERMIEPALADKRGHAIFTSCIVADSMMVTEDGIIEIGDLYNGEKPGTYVPYECMVAGFRGPMEKATKFYVSGMTPTIKLVNGLGTGIEGTYDHRVWAMRDGVAQWIELQDLKIGDWVATRVGANVWGNDDDTSDFVKDFSHGNTLDFDTKLTPKIAYLLGYIIGNGYIDFTNNRVSVSTAEPIIEKFLTSLGFKQYKSKNNEYGWIIGRKVFVDYLRYLGFESNKGPTKVIPKRLLRCSRHTIKHLLSGLFDADGSAHIERDIVKLDSSSKRLIEQVQFLLINFGVVGRISKTIKKPSKKVKVSSTAYTLEMSGAFAQRFHEEIGFELKRKQRNLLTRPNRFYGAPTQAVRIGRLFKKYKAPQGHGRFSSRPNLTYNIDYLSKAGFASYEKIEELLNRLEPYAHDDNDWQYLKSLCAERYYWSQIKSLTTSQNNTFDLVIPTTHAFISNTLINHNTPEGKNFFYELWQRGLDDNEPDFESWQYPTWENDIIFPGGYNDPEIQRLKRNMPEDAFAQEICADFTSFTGKIYKEFVELTHVKNHTYNPDWPNYISWDFGYNAPTAAIEFQVSPRDTIHVWREHYKAGMIMDEHFYEMCQRDQPEGYKIDLMFGDSADPQAIEEICVKFGPCVGDPRAKENWRDGINEVKKFLKMRSDGVPGLLVDPSCKNTIREFNNYKAVDGGKDRDPREQAKKSEDHSMDAIRYGIMHIFRLGMRDRLSDAMSSSNMRSGLSDSGFVTHSQNDAYPALASSGFVTLDGQRF